MITLGVSPTRSKALTRVERNPCCALGITNGTLTLLTGTGVDFDLLVEQPAEPPELVVFGSGARLRFAPPALLRGLMARRIGVETMDTAAACRTYNILAGEGRRVVAALLLET